MTLQELEKEILRLPPEDRALLAEHLLASLEGDVDADDVHSAWMEEAQRRRDAYKAGRIRATSAESAIAAARTKLG